MLIQTYMPEQPVMKALAANDRDRFLEAEAAQRRDAHLPPFARLAALIVSATVFVVALLLDCGGQLYLSCEAR